MAFHIVQLAFVTLISAHIALASEAAAPIKRPLSATFSTNELRNVSSMLIMSTPTYGASGSLGVSQLHVPTRTHFHQPTRNAQKGDTVRMLSDALDRRPAYPKFEITSKTPSAAVTQQVRKLYSSTSSHGHKHLPRLNHSQQGMKHLVAPKARFVKRLTEEDKNITSEIRECFCRLMLF